ncbi:hypothetical protein [Serratia oryzae]|uniref:hypothetical protein n=1 Tax=Serratia oryzae TaxID=2034155 RepID=UPI000F78351E|nr:hypothetical protein [Serratia oryzae]
MNEGSMWQQSLASNMRSPDAYLSVRHVVGDYRASRYYFAIHIPKTPFAPVLIFKYFDEQQ